MTNHNQHNQEAALNLAEINPVNKAGDITSGHKQGTVLKRSGGRF